MANGYIPAAVERGCDPCSQVKLEQKAFLGGVLGIDINGELQPISEDGIVDLSFVMDETEAAAEQATASAAAAAESAQTASEAATSAQSSETAAQSAANAAEAAKDAAEDAASSANASKNTADSYATAAQTAAAAAQIADGNAERSAESAIAAAAQAASSAGNALSSANDAYTSASAAQAAADAAQTAQAAAEASEATASTAATTATQAKETAQTAQTAAEAAQATAAQSATAASGSATAAAGSATQAAASATAAAGSATAAAASAATFETDPTLTAVGKAADSAAVGNEIRYTRQANGIEYQQGWWGATSGGYDNAHANAICSKEYFQNNVGIVTASSGYKFRLQAWTAADDYVGIWNGTRFAAANPNFFLHEADLDGFRASYPGYKYKIVAYHEDGTSSISPSDAGVISYRVSKLVPEQYAYSSSGEHINTKGQGFNIFQPNYALPNPATYGSSARQDFDIYNGVLFQLMSTNQKVVLVNLETGAVVGNYAITCGHGNSCQFGKTLEAESDEYPPLYCYDYNYAKVYKNKVTGTGATLEATYDLSAVPGHRYCGGYDADNNLLVSISYAQNSSTDATNNYMTFAVWDINNLTDEGGGIYAPALLKSRAIPFVPVVQGCTVFRNRLYVTCGLSGTAPIKILAFDYDGICVTAIDDFPTNIKTSEAEAITFYKTGKDYECWFATYGLYKLVFEM